MARSAALGAVSGARSFTGLAAVSLTTPQHQERQPERAYGSWPVRALVSAGAIGELVGDQLPTTPSRLEPAPLVARLAGGAICGVLIARRLSRRPAPTVLALAAGTGLACAGLEAVAGTRWRAWAAGRFGGDVPGALIEDALALAAAWATTRS